MATRWTDLFIRKLEARATRYDLREGDGFTVRVSPTGTKTFYFLFTLNGRKRRLFLGEYDTRATDPKGRDPDADPMPYKGLVSLKRARSRHTAALSIVRAGTDPVEMIEREDAAAAAQQAVERPKAREDLAPRLVPMPGLGPSMEAESDTEEQAARLFPRVRLRTSRHPREGSGRSTPRPGSGWHLPVPGGLKEALGSGLSEGGTVPPGGAADRPVLRLGRQGIQAGQRDGVTDSDPGVRENPEPPCGGVITSGCEALWGAGRGGDRRARGCLIFLRPDGFLGF